MYFASVIMERKNNNKSYQSTWKIWWGWCSTRGWIPLIPLFRIFSSSILTSDESSLVECLSFSYFVHFSQVNGVSVGQHPLIVRLMKGAFHLRSPAPRYEATWPVHKVASFLMNLGSSTDLSLKWLSWKLVTLMALALYPVGAAQNYSWWKFQESFLMSREWR